MRVFLTTSGDWDLISDSTAKELLEEMLWGGAVFATLQGARTAFHGDVMSMWVELDPKDRGPTCPSADWKEVEVRPGSLPVWQATNPLADSEVFMIREVEVQA